MAMTVIDIMEGSDEAFRRGLEKYRFKPRNVVKRVFTNKPLITCYQHRICGSLSVANIKIRPEHDVVLVQIVESDPTITLLEIRREFARRTGLLITKRPVIRALERQGVVNCLCFCRRLQASRKGC